MAKEKYTVSKLLWWIQKAASKGLYVYFEVTGHEYDFETGWDFGTIDPSDFKIKGEVISTEGYTVPIKLKDIDILSLCKLEPYKDGRMKIIPVR